MIYLDNAATTMIKPPAVARAMAAAVNTMASPGRGGHRPAMAAAETVYRCRLEAAELFNVPEPESVVFTMNATHALNIAIHSLVRPGMKVLISGYEHNSVTRPLAALGADIMVAQAPMFDRAAQLQAFLELLPQAELVVCTHVSNVFGAILPAEEIAAACRRASLPFILDASQSAGCLDIDMQALGAAFIAMPGHKGLFGPQGTGLLLCCGEGEPLLWGGSGSDSIAQAMPPYLPDRLEAGTHNVCGIAGLLEGIRYVKSLGPGEILRHEQELLWIMADELRDLDDLELFLGPEGSQTGVLSLRPKGRDPERLGEELGERGVAQRSGLHCAPLAHRSAGTIESGTLRFSFSPFNTPDQVRAACQVIKDLTV